MAGPLAELFRPTIIPRKGPWVHMNAVREHYGYSVNKLREFIELNGIVVTPQDDWRLTRIYFHVDWLELLKSREPLAHLCLLQSHIRDEELKEAELNRRFERSKSAFNSASPKQRRLLERLSESKYLNDSERKLLKDVLEYGCITKDRAIALLTHLIGSSFIQENGFKWRTSDGILNERKRRQEIAKQAG